ncbi:uncharacterized protein FIBRA_03101 [Fibroporia radiculosa]|uniref:C2H2-type domain-containing protein n=1 Tax=Fibroporia radiculosa TaxID=599839 RepID=J4G460_9APHY|nr:uncharacterized protein FIBRA_03101 [Fibroporia radiculosa]CCM01053.1 predicted protein [Fibroporia radiculosa]
MSLAEHPILQSLYNQLLALLTGPGDRHCTAVCLREQNKHFRVYPDLNGSSFRTAVSALNTHVAIKARTSAIQAVLANAPFPADSIRVDKSTYVPIVDAFTHLSDADISQYAAFVRDEAVLVVWSDSPDSILSSYRDLEHRLQHQAKLCHCSEVPSVLQDPFLSGNFFGAVDSCLFINEPDELAVDPLTINPLDSLDSVYKSITWSATGLTPLPELDGLQNIRRGQSQVFIATPDNFDNFGIQSHSQNVGLTELLQARSLCRMDSSFNFPAFNEPFEDSPASTLYISPNDGGRLSDCSLQAISPAAMLSPSPSPSYVSSISPAMSYLSPNYAISPALTVSSPSSLYSLSATTSPGLNTFQSFENDDAKVSDDSMSDYTELPPTEVASRRRQQPPSYLEDLQFMAVSPESPQVMEGLPTLIVEPSRKRGRPKTSAPPVASSSLRELKPAINPLPRSRRKTTHPPDLHPLPGRPIATRGALFLTATWSPAQSSASSPEMSARTVGYKSKRSERDEEEDSGVKADDECDGLGEPDEEQEQDDGDDDYRPEKEVSAPSPAKRRKSSPPPEEDDPQEVSKAKGKTKGKARGRGGKRRRSSKEKKAHCPNCGEPFTRNTDVKRHLTSAKCNGRPPPDARMAQCPHCPSAFLRPDALVRHKQTVHIDLYLDH